MVPLIPPILAIAASAIAVSGASSPQTTDAPQNPIGGYIPKWGYAVVALLLFGLLAAIQWTHFARMGRKYMLILTIGLTCMSFGFVMRIVQCGFPYTLIIYIIEDLFILLTPCAFLAMDYVLLERLAAHLGSDVSTRCLLIPARRIVKIFVWSDAATFFLQASGGGLTATSSTSLSKLGSDIAMGGLILQLISFSLFTVMLLTFGWRVRTRYNHLWRPVRQSNEPSLFRFWCTTEMGDWRVLYFAMAFTCIGILVRSVYRICEYAEGYNGYIPTHESFFYLLDSLPLWLAMSVYCFVWPPRWLHTLEKEATYVGELTGMTARYEGRAQ